MASTSNEKVELYISQYCTYSQRARIVLCESGMPFELFTLPENGVKPPKWFYQVSPHGILPVLKHGRVVPIGCDDITRHLEKVSSKVARLSTAKKKHIAPTLHCKTTIEPLVEQLLDPVNSEQSPLLVKLFYHELGTLESAIKGPFYSSSGFSMVDINYWTILQRIPLLNYMHGIELNAFPNIRAWMDRVAKRESCAKCAIEARGQLLWFQSLRGRGNLQPHITAIELAQIVNNALRRGVEELLDMVLDDHFLEYDKLKSAVSHCNQLEIVLREHSSCKMDLIIPAFSEKDQPIPEFLYQAWLMQGKSLKSIGSLLDLLFLHASIRSESVRDDRQDSQPVAQLLEWKRQKLEQQNSCDNLRQQLEKAVKEFNVSLLKDLGREETILSLDVSESLFTKYELFNLTREVAFFLPEPILAIHVPWVVSHLKDTTQIRSFVLYYRFAMAFQFTPDILSWLKIGLPSDLWTDVCRQLEKTQKTEIHLQKQYCSDRGGAPPVPPRKRTDAPRPSASTKLASALVDQPADHSDNDFSLRNPVIILELLSASLKTRLRSVKDICTGNVAGVGLSTLEDSLNMIFGFLTVKHLYEERTLLPFLKRKSKELRLLVNSAHEDNKMSKECMTRASSLLIELRMATTVSPEAMRELIDAVFHALSIELHRLFKQKQIFKLIYKHATFDEQAHLLREILDQSPISFVNSLIPWLLKQMAGDKQVVFITALKNVLLEEDFEKLFVPIRKVLPISVSNSFLNNQTTRLSM